MKKIFIFLILGMCLIGFVSGALELGTNAGFVTTAPTTDPEGITITGAIDNKATAIYDTSPIGNNIITEIGWWCQNIAEESDFEVGIYNDDGGGEYPTNLIGKSSAVAKGTTAGWKKITGLNIPISSSTIYWIAMQLDDTTTDTKTDYINSGALSETASGNTELSNPFGIDAGDSITLAYYAVYEASAFSTIPHTKFKDGKLQLKDGRFRLYG